MTNTVRRTGRTGVLPAALLVPWMVLAVGACGCGGPDEERQEPMNPQVASALEKLKHAEASVRQDAAEALGYLGDRRTVGPLKTAMLDTSRDVRRKAAESLTRLEWRPAIDAEKAVFLLAMERWQELETLGPVAAEPLVAWLGTTTSGLTPTSAYGAGGPVNIDTLLPGEWTDRAQGSVVDLLAKTGPPAFRPLLGALGSDSGQARWLAAMALGKLGDARAVERLTALLADTMPTVRIEAARALGRLGDARAVDALVALLKDTDDGAQAMAAWALVKMGPKRAVAPLIDALKSNQQSWKGRAAVAWALAQLQDPRAVEPLIDAMSPANDAGGRNVSTPTRWIAWALGRLGDKRALAPLKARLASLKRHDRGAREAILAAIETIERRE